MLRLNVAAALSAALLGIVPAAAWASAQSEKLATCLHQNAGQADKEALVQWVFVAIGRTSPAREVVRIPDAKTRQVESNAQKMLTRLVTKHCAREAATLAFTDPKNGLQDTLGELARKLAADELKKRVNPVLPLTITDLLTP